MPAGLLGNKSSLIRRAAGLRITARQMAEGLRSGSFRSLQRGQGIEFSGVREYFRGDDIRAIDWNVTARMGKPFVKMFEEERELVVFLVVDRSLSMQTPSSGGSRLYTASEASALMTFACEYTHSSVGAVLFDGEITFSCAPRSGTEQTMLIVSRLDEEPQRQQKGSVLGGALTGAARLLKKRSLVFIFSDFRTTGWEQPLTVLAGRHDVVAVRITAPADEELPDIGFIPFEDPETGEHVFLPTSSLSFRRAWKDDHLSRLYRWRDICLHRGAVPLMLSTVEDPGRALVRFFESGERRR